MGTEMAANDKQVGGEHYKKGGEEHWDRAWRLKYDCFQYIITKWVERWKEKGGVEDLKKAQHAIEKYIELQSPPMQPGHVVNYGPNPLTKQTGWVGFVFEGGTVLWDQYTCRRCGATVYTAVNVSPYKHHQHGDDMDGAEPDHRYTNQD
jgi:hypothetical protein